MLYGNSIWTFISIFIILIISTKSYHTDGDYFCANHTEQCENTLSLPCCDLNDKCTPIDRGAFQHELRCLKEAYLEDRCEATLDCHKVNYAECSKEKKCKCHLIFIAVGNSKCIIPLNGFCTSDRDCLIQNSTCKDSRCKCKFDFRPTSDNQCEQKKLFKFCRKDKDCEDIIHAKCNNDYECVCRANNVAVNDSVCLPEIDAFCWKNEPCAIENSICTDSTCKCKPEYKNINNKFCLKTYLDMPCEKNRDCTGIKNAACDSLYKICDCSEKSRRLNETYCAPLLEGYCVDDNECLPDNSICFNNACTCKPNLMSVAQFYCTSIPLGESCQADFDCKDTKHRKCSDGLCVCQSQHISMNGSVCLPVISGFCYTSDECEPDNSYCFVYRCQCKPGFIQSSVTSCVDKNELTNCLRHDDWLADY